MSAPLDRVRAEIVIACRSLAAEGLVLGTAGNISVRVGELIAITATGADFATLTTEEVTVVDSAGAVRHGTLAPTSELDLHLGVYRGTDAGAVVHTHAPSCVAVGLIVDELPCLHYQMLTFGGVVRVAPYATFGSAELAAAVLTALSGKSAALMANHGAVTYAATLRTALESTRLLEWAAAIYLRAAPLGPVRGLSVEEQTAVITQAIRRNYGSTKDIGT
ncbi:class II aldolase/adducin family protein [Nocardia sp. NPDC050710]|uniref:class II aldolase/adducin family protein n=1 Tax=Nocardia sp. NPDC050710 TaxID=3157220 RepID=UPI0034096935